MNIKVFGELLFERDQNDPLLDHIIICIYGLLKKHIQILISANLNRKEIYNDIKTLIFECVKKRYLNLDNPTYIMRNYICDCISILIISGITSSWSTCIADLIKEAKSGNTELIFIALRAIADCDLIINFYESDNDDNYWDDNLNFKEMEKKEIKNQLINNSELVFGFINEIYSIINKFEKKLKNRIIKSIIDLVTFWTKLNLNILINQRIYTTIMDLINMVEEENDKIENLKSMGELINNSIISSHNCKIYEFYDKVNEYENPSETLQNIQDNININEKNGINNCLDYILQKINEYNNSKNKNENIIWIYAKILSSFLENYIYFFFDFNNERNINIFNLLKYFISHKKRKISWMFFNSIDSMMNFITDYYRFYGVSDIHIKQFTDYLIEILLNIMDNCALTKFNSNDYSQLLKLILFKNNELNWEIKDQNYYYNNMNDDDLDLDDIDIKEYRNSAEHVFFCIYTIFKEGLNSDYDKYFINRIISLIDIKDEKIKNNYDEKNAKILDVILLVLKSILVGFDIESSPEIVKIINEYIYYLSDSIYIQKINTNIFIDYLILINQIGYFLISEQKYFEKAILILLLVSDRKDVNQYLIDSCYKVISNLCGDLIGKMNFYKIFDIFSERYNKIYNLYNINNLSPLEDLINSMFYVMGINRINGTEIYENDKNIISFINKILEPINNSLQLLLYDKNNNNINNLQSCIIKAYLLYKVIFHNIQNTNNSIRKIVFNDFITKSMKDLVKIFNIFPDNMDIFTPIKNFYISNAIEICEDCLCHFSTINEIFLELFKLNSNYFEIIDFLEIIYNHVLQNLNKNDNNYIEQNKYLLDNFFILIKYSIQYIKLESTFIEQLLHKIKLFTITINDVFPLLDIPAESNDSIKNIIKVVIEIFVFLTNIIDSIIIKKEIKDIISDNLISYIIKSIASLFNDNIIKNLLNHLSNEQNEELINKIVLSTWKLLNIPKFQFLSCQELCSLYYQTSLINFEIFAKYFIACLKSSVLLSDKEYVNINNYIILFCKDKDKIIGFIKEILLIAYDKKNPDCLDYYFNQLNRKKNL